MIRIALSDSGAHPAIARLLQQLGNPQAGLKAIGELVTEFTKTRFALSQDPYGTPWVPNKPSTIEAMLRGHAKNFTKKGAVSARGQRALAGKKPLIGESKSLSKQFAWRVVGNAVEVRSSMVYAAIQNFGGTKASFPHLWGNIPARPFFPDAARGLPPALGQRIHQVLSEALLG